MKVCKNLHTVITSIKQTLTKTFSFRFNSSYSMAEATDLTRLVFSLPHRSSCIQ